MKHRARSKFARIALLLLGGLMLPIISAWAEQKIPDAKLRVTIQQKEAGKLNPALHVQEIVCTNGGYNTPQKLDRGIRCMIACRREKEERQNAKHAQES